MSSTPHLISLELEAMHWRWHRTRDIVAIADETWHTLTISGNVSWRIGKPTMGGTIAVGAGVQRSTLTDSHCIRDCHALPYGRTFATHFVETTPHAQMGGSVDKAITPRLIGFGTTRFVLGKERGLAVTGGVRLRFGSRTVMVF